MKITKKNLLEILNKLQNASDTEGAHIDADDALLDFIDDKDINEAYGKINKWYA